MKEHVAGSERHLVELRDVPCAHDEAPARGIFFDLIDDAVNLIDDGAIGAVPVGPLRAVDAAEISFFVGPLIPNRDAVFVQVTHVGVAAQEPEQLVDDRLEMQLLRGEQRKSFAQIEPRLRAENRRVFPCRFDPCAAFRVRAQAEADRDIGACVSEINASARSIQFIISMEHKAMTATVPIARWSLFHSCS